MTGDPARDHEATEHRFAAPDVPWTDDDYTAAQQAEQTRVPEPYYADESVTLYHGDCLQITAWLSADVLLTDPPYGIGYTRSIWSAGGNSTVHLGIANDDGVGTRNAALAAWGEPRPALVFGSLRAEYPTGWHRMLVFQKPIVSAGLFGQRLPWFANWEPVFVLGDWPRQKPTRSAVIATRWASSGGYRGYATDAGHAHAKPLDVMEALVDAVPPGVIADPFAGSGATLIAARNLGRRAVGVEIEERYCEIAAKRLAQGVLEVTDT